MTWGYWYWYVGTVLCSRFGSWSVEIMLLLMVVGDRGDGAGPHARASEAGLVAPLLLEAILLAS